MDLENNTEQEQRPARDAPNADSGATGHPLRRTSSNFWSDDTEASMKPSASAPQSLALNVLC
jgi:hypothetical protein